MTSLPPFEIFTLITSQILLMSKNKYILYGGIALILLLIAGICVTVFKVADLRKEVTDAQAANEHYVQYEGKVQDAAQKVNDAYLKAFSEESGVQSYGEVADLLIAWYLQKTA